MRLTAIQLSHPLGNAETLEAMRSPISRAEESRHWQLEQ